MKLRFAIYARYSSDLQNPSSVIDQIALCKRLINERFGTENEISTFSDEAISGATMNRPGLTQLLDTAADGCFNYVVAEGLDRLSRSLADTAIMYQFFCNANTQILTEHEGEVTDVHVGLKGTMNALFLKDMKVKVKRAHRAIHEAGRHTSSVAYGYRAIRGVTDERGRYVNGLREINPEQAAVIHRIFTDVAQGVGITAIVKALNDEGIPSPSGRAWRPHTLRGSRARGDGILNNELYRGRLVYNRTRKVTDPRTGRSKYVVNDQDEWNVREVEELRIVSDELWQQVADRAKERKARKAITKRGKAHYHYGHGQVRALTGLVVCGWCRSRKAVGNERRYICDTYRFGGQQCKNARGTKEEILAAAVFNKLNASADSCRDWNQLMEGKLNEVIEKERHILGEIETMSSRLKRLMRAIEYGIEEEGTLKKALALQARIKELKRRPSRPPLDLDHEQIYQRIKATLAEMERCFLQPKYASSIHRLLALVVNKIVLTPIKGQRTGEDITVVLNRHGWPEFYLLAHAEWPQIGGSS